MVKRLVKEFFFAFKSYTYLPLIVVILKLVALVDYIYRAANSIFGKAGRIASDD